MKTKLRSISNLSAVFALVTLLLIPGLGWGQGNEDFTNLPTASSSSYAARSWTGTNGVTWTAALARTDQTLNGKAICWGNSGTRNVISPSYSGGMGTLTFNYVRAFTGTSARTLQVWVNGTQIGSNITVNPNSDVVVQYSEVINVAGNVVLEIRSTGAAQVKVDDISWTAYSSGANLPPDISNIEISPSTGIISTTTISVSADVTDSDGTVEGVKLHWGTTTGNLGNTINMSLDGGSTYTTDTDIPAQTGGTTVYYEIYAIDDDADETTSTERSYYVASSEPTNHATSLSATSPNSSTITVTWDDNDGSQPASGFLILANKTGTFTDPVDGTPQTDDETLADGTGIKNIASGVETYSWINLDASTQYFFRVYPYTNSGSAINYKTDGSIPEAETTTQAPAIESYTWIGADNASWAVSTNWSPSRTTPANTDVLIFNDETTKTVTAVPSQTIGQLFVTDNTIVTLQPAATGTTITINGGTGNDFEIESGSGIIITGTNTLVIALGASATGSVNGTITMAGGAHRFQSPTASGITFNSGSVFTAGTAFSGNPFGTTSLNSVIFTSGSTYVAIGGSNPFGASAPNSVVVFQAGSLYKLSGNISPALSGRTYADMEMDVVGYAATVSGASAGSVNNLTITNGTLNFNLTATPGYSIKGNITVQTGATLNFNPSSAGTVNLNGTTQQTISGGGTLSSNASSTLVINNASGVVLDKNATLTGNLTITAGTFSINSGRQLTVSGTLNNTPGNSGLIIKSDASGTGSLINSTSGVAATVEKYVSGSPEAWHLLSSPVASQSITGDFTPTGTYGDGTGYDFYKWDEPSINWLNQKVAGNNITSFVPGEGYLVAYQAANPTKTFTGQLNTGDQSIALTVSGTSTFQHSNLIGNPFASAIDWKSGSGFDKSKLISDEGGYNMYIWNENAGNYGVFNDASTGDEGTNSVGRYIPSMQGFFVIAEQAGNFTVNNNAKIHNPQAWLKSENESEFRMVVTAPESKGSDEILLQFGHDTSVGGALKWNSFVATAPGLYVPDLDKNYSIRFLTSVADHKTVPVAFVPGVDGNYSINADFNTALFGSVVLEDKKTGNTYDLTMSPVYNFSAVTNDDVNRFTIHFSAVGIDDNISSSGISVYSGNRSIYVSLQNNAGAVIKVYSLTGQLITQKTTEVNTLSTINTSSLHNGIYIVNVVNGHQVISRKVIVSK